MDLSAAKFNRSNLEGRHSSLIHEALRVLREVKAAFPHPTVVHFLFENVASMDASARDQDVLMVPKLLTVLKEQNVPQGYSYSMAP